MPVGILTVQFSLPGCKSLKEKRSRMAPILTHIHKKFNVSISETAMQDNRLYACVSCAMVSNDKVHIEQCIQSILKYIEIHWPDELILRSDIEIL